MVGVVTQIWVRSSQPQGPRSRAVLAVSPPSSSLAQRRASPNGRPSLLTLPSSPGRPSRSEGPQPHSIALQFPHRVQILVSSACSLLITGCPEPTRIALTLSIRQKISIHLSHPKDDSYTPQKISIRAGTGRHDLTEVRSRLSRRGHVQPGGLTLDSFISSIYPGAHA